MKNLFVLLSIAGGMARAQPLVTPPQAGFMRDGANSLRPVYGIGGSFVLGGSIAGSVVSAAYSGSYGLIKTNSAVLVTDKAGSIVASSPTLDGPALFAFKITGEPSLVYLPAAGMLLAWNAGTFAPLPFEAETLRAAAVLSISTPRFGPAAVIVQRDDGLWNLRIRLSTGQIVAQSALPGITAPVLMLATGEMVYNDANGIVLRANDGAERHIPASLPAHFEFEQMDKDWIQLRDLASSHQFAIRITQNREQFYQLPEVGQ